MSTHYALSVIAKNIDKINNQGMVAKLQQNGVSDQLLRIIDSNQGHPGHFFSQAKKLVDIVESELQQNPNPADWSLSPDVIKQLAGPIENFILAMAAAEERAFGRAAVTASSREGADPDAWSPAGSSSDYLPPPTNNFQEQAIGSAAVTDSSREGADPDAWSPAGSSSDYLPPPNDDFQKRVDALLKIADAIGLTSTIIKADPTAVCIILETQAPEILRLIDNYAKNGGPIPDLPLNMKEVLNDAALVAVNIKEPYQSSSVDASSSSHAVPVGIASSAAVSSSGAEILSIEAKAVLDIVKNLDITPPIAADQAQIVYNLASKMPHGKEQFDTYIKDPKNADLEGLRETIEKVAPMVHAVSNTRQSTGGDHPAAAAESQSTTKLGPSIQVS